MNKERKVIESNAIVVFDRNVAAEELNTLFDDFQGDIIITGNLNLGNVDLFLKCNNLYIIGDMNVGDNSITEIVGNLYVGGNIRCYYLRVNGCICCYGDLLSDEVDVAEDLFVKEGIDACDKDINVGGDLICNSDIESSDKIHVLNRLEVQGSINAKRILVG